MRPLRAAEFYSGIGGLHLALRDVPGFEFEVVAAYEINTAANDVYRHNYPNVPLLQRNILSITPDELGSLNADIYLMSPPCQPFTRQGKQRDTADRRTDSFMHLLDTFSRLSHSPEYILLENVKGFEVSEACRHLQCFLRSAGYFYREFLLNPVHFGIPNSRLRYYMIAKLSSDFQFASSEEICHELPSCSMCGPPAPLDSFLELSHSDWSTHLVHDRILVKYGDMLDIVTPRDTRSCCFTKGYGRYVEGTGSVVQLSEELERDLAYDRYRSATSDTEKANSLRPLRLRYFTPREIANLMCFPADFKFPASTSRKQQYRLLGNSVNIRVVNELVKMLVGATT